MLKINTQNRKMELKKITQKTCACGARTVRDECQHFHVNGQGFEEREFECGAAIKWSPNFERIEFVSVCPKSAEAQKAESDRLEVEHRVFKAIDGANVSLACKREWQARIRWERASYHDHEFKDERQSRTRGEGVSN